MLYRAGRDFLGRHPGIMAGITGKLLGLVPHGIRYGAEFRRMRSFLDRSQWWPRPDLEAYQLRKLQETLEYAGERIPYYRDRFARAGVQPSDLRRLDDLRRFPMLSKVELRDELERIRAPHLDPGRLMPFITGGTSGSGMILHFEERFRQREQAFIWRLWNRAGYREGMRAVVLQHRPCPPDLNDGLYYMDWVSNALIISASRLSRDTIAGHLERIEQLRPEIVVAYPSLAYLFAVYAHDAGWKGEGFRAVLCSSETLYDFQRRLLEQVFRAPVRIHYGHIESCALFGYCEHSPAYHVEPEYGFVEVLGADDAPVGPGEVGEIVATSFDNFAVPLVRYRTGDWARLPEEPTPCPCGREFRRIDEIQGREGDYIVTPSGKAHAPIVVEVLMDDVLKEGFDGFDDLQIVQDRAEELAVLVVPGRTFRPEQIEEFCRRLEERLDGEVRATHRLVDRIPRTFRHKKSLVVSKLRVSPLRPLSDESHPAA